MRFNIDMPLDAIRELARRCVEALNSNRQPIRQTMGGKLREMALADFDRKANGAPGVDGTVWAPDSLATQRAKGSRLIGVNSGELRNSFEVTEGADGADVTLAYTADHAEWFDRKRLLLPEEVPGAWLDVIEGDASRWLQRTVQAEVDKS